MRILFLGDVVGRSGREVVMTHVPRLKQQLSLDCVIVNGENASHGFGLSARVARDLFDVGVDVITLGNHAWDRKELLREIGGLPQIIRPANYPPGTPGQGFYIFETSKEKRVLVINVMGRLFMDPLDDPFRAVDTILTKYRLKANVHAIVVDIHAETTSEKMAMGHYLDGRASLVVGTHTHVPTADHRILSKGTAYQTDAGMCGDYDSVIGMAKEASMARFLKRVPGERLEPALGSGSLCGILVDVSDATGLASHVYPVRIGGSLSACDIEILRIGNWCVDSPNASP